MLINNVWWEDKQKHNDTQMNRHEDFKCYKVVDCGEDRQKEKETQIAGKIEKGRDFNDWYVKMKGY